jgi:2-succinyl-5-enolpyruvyl-6-hydroxy-3-cyclohexene-1-carboxylate synthase
MPLLKPLFGISEICVAHGIKDAVLCPGSRSAALTLAFARNPKISCEVLSDERSAGFVAMGMAIQTDTPVVMVCTSGSAAYNFSPAVVEAYFQEVPLIVLTADRPPEWINQYDGQTIFQRDIFGKHVKKSYELPADYAHLDAQWHIERVVNEAISLSQKHPKGPVHINVPIREPFYPDANEEYDFNGNVRVVKNPEIKPTLSNAVWAELLEIWEAAENKIIAIGQNSEDLDAELTALDQEEEVIVIADVISNVNTEKAIKSHDTFIAKLGEAESEIDLLLTFGKSFISKNLKQFIRKNKPTHHWHIQNHPDLIDPLQSLTLKIEMDPKEFLRELSETCSIRRMRSADEAEECEFKTKWLATDEKAKIYVDKFLASADFGELKATQLLLEQLPESSILHLGNSMPVRYANLFGTKSSKKIQVNANRGTSGIDGIVSTSVGQAKKTDKVLTCLVGDVSFFYDRNAFWNANLPNNLKIVLINNEGGNIFRIIDGPSKQAEVADYFVGKQTKTAELLAKENSLEYLKASNEEEMKNALKSLYEANKASILEVFTYPENDVRIFKDLKNGFSLI